VDSRTDVALFHNISVPVNMNLQLSLFLASTEKIIIAIYISAINN